MTSTRATHESLLKYTGIKYTYWSMPPFIYSTQLLSDETVDCGAVLACTHTHTHHLMEAEGGRIHTHTQPDSQPATQET